MRWIVPMLLVAFATGCAGPGARNDDTMRRMEAKRELERECRMAARAHMYNPDCPQAEEDPFARQPPPPVVTAPPPPSVSLPRK